MRQVQVNQNKAVQHLWLQVHECKLQVQVQGQNDKVYATAGSQLENSWMYTWIKLHHEIEMHHEHYRSRTRPGKYQDKCTATIIMAPANYGYNHITRPGTKYRWIEACSKQQVNHVWLQVKGKQATILLEQTRPKIMIYRLKQNSKVQGRTRSKSCATEQSQINHQSFKYQYQVCAKVNVEQVRDVIVKQTVQIQSCESQATIYTKLN